MITSRSQTCIDTLKPEVQPLAVKFLNSITGLPTGWTVQIISGSRTYAEQTALYNQPREGKPFVTKAPAGYSLHNFGLAFDIGIFDEKGRYIDDVVGNPDQYYRKLGAVGIAAGLEWGGNWYGTFQDYPHYQYNPLHLSLLDMRSRTAAGKSLFHP